VRVLMTMSVVMVMVMLVPVIMMMVASACLSAPQGITQGTQCPALYQTLLRHQFLCRREP